MALRFLKKTAPTDKDGREAARMALEAALGQRAKFHLALDEKVTGIADLSASLAAVTSKGLVLELAAIKRVPASWVGAFLRCYFQIVDRGDKRKRRFLTFAGRILEARNANEIASITVGLPDAITSGQRRKSLRVAADLERFSHVALWRYEGSGFDLKNPLATFEHFRRRQAVMENISAGGMRLSLSSALLKESGFVPEKGGRLIAHLSLAKAAPPMDKPFWIIARIRQAVVDFASKDAMLGLEFAVEGAVAEQTGKVLWKKVENNVIERLGQATYLWHVELYREKGVFDA